jgi:hypothetical protein
MFYMVIVLVVTVNHVDGTYFVLYRRKMLGNHQNHVFLYKLYSFWGKYGTICGKKCCFW